jgi:hypothetical protein
VEPKLVIGTLSTEKDSAYVSRVNGLVALSHPRFPVFPWGQLFVDDNGQRIGVCLIMEALFP